MVTTDIVLRNAFNNETFVFSPQSDHPDIASFEVVLEEGGSGGGNALIHVHPVADETFTVRSGRLMVAMNGKERIVEAGQSVTVLRGTPHYFRNVESGPTEFTVAFSPAQNHLRFFQNFAMLTQNRPDWFSPKGDPDLLLVALVFHAYRNHIYLAASPIWLQKFVFAALAKVARWRGYNLEIEPDGRKLCGCRRCEQGTDH